MKDFGCLFVHGRRQGSAAILHKDSRSAQMLEVTTLQHKVHRNNRQFSDAHISDLGPAELPPEGLRDAVAGILELFWFSPDELSH